MASEDELFAEFGADAGMFYARIIIFILLT